MQTTFGQIAHPFLFTLSTKVHFCPGLHFLQSFPHFRLRHINGCLQLSVATAFGTHFAIGHKLHPLLPTMIFTSHKWLTGQFFDLHGDSSQLKFLHLAGVTTVEFCRMSAMYEGLILLHAILSQTTHPFASFAGVLGVLTHFSSLSHFVAQVGQTVLGQIYWGSILVHAILSQTTHPLASLAGMLGVLTHFSTLLQVSQFGHFTSGHLNGMHFVVGQPWQPLIIFPGYDWHVSLCLHSEPT